MTAASVPVLDPFLAAADPSMPWLRQALDPHSAQAELRGCLRERWSGGGRVIVCAIRVTRHKLGRRCLIEYDLRDGSGELLTVIGKVRARGLDRSGFQTQAALWAAGFQSDSSDAIAVPEPLGMVPAFEMWLQRRVPGVPLTALLMDPEIGVPGLAPDEGARNPRRGGPVARPVSSLSVPQGDRPGRPARGAVASRPGLEWFHRDIPDRVAEAIHKLHNAGVPTQRVHTIDDELRILEERLGQVAAGHSGWKKRLARVLAGCERLARRIPSIAPRGVHRDFYPDQIVVERGRLYLLDFDLYAAGDPALDIGNFAGHLTELRLRAGERSSWSLAGDRQLTARFLSLTPGVDRETIESYRTLTLARHIWISTRFPERRPLTASLLELCEQRLG